MQHLPEEMGEQNFVEVPCVPLDPMVHALDLNPSVIKIDVEGAEHLVLQGAQESVAKDGVRLLLEVHHEYLTQRGKSANDVLVQVADLGKEIYYIEGDEDGPYKYMQKMDPAQPITLPNFRVVAR